MLSFVFLSLFLKESITRQKHRLDYIGIILLTGTVILFLHAQIAQRLAPVLARFAGSAGHLPKNIAPSNILLTPDLRTSLPVAFLEQLKNALSQSLFWVYALMLVLALLAAITMFWFPHDQTNPRAKETAGAGGEAGEIPRRVSITDRH